MRKGKKINVITKLNENFKYGFILDKSSNCVTQFDENPISSILVGDQILLGEMRPSPLDPIPE